MPLERIWPLVGFHVLVFILLAIDLGVFHRKAHEVRAREAAIMSVVWISLAALFCAWVFYAFGRQSALDFATAYVVEKSLSVDNLIVFVAIFSTFRVPPEARHRILYWGVLGAICLRAPLILLGVELLQHVWWITYVFAGWLIITGLKFLVVKEDDDEEIRESALVRWLKRIVPTTDGLRGTRIIVRENGRTLVTPLFMILVIVELMDVVFATDSIPAVLGVTKDFFVAYTSNIFAILGLRALFFLVAAGIEKFHYLKPALSFVLVFVGVKMILKALEVIDIPTGLSLGVILVSLLVAGFFSARARKAQARAAAAASMPVVEAPPAP